MQYSDIPGLEKQVQAQVRKELKHMTDKYNDLETRINDMIHERLEGYSDVYQSLHENTKRMFDTHCESLTANLVTKVNALIAKHQCALVQQQTHKMQSMVDELRSFQVRVDDKIANIERHVMCEQPKALSSSIQRYVKKEKLKHFQALASPIHKQSKLIKNASKAALKAEKTCSKLADDVYHRLQTQVYIRTYRHT